MTQDQQIYIDSIKDIYEYIGYNADDNIMVFCEIFNGQSDPEYLSYVTIEDGYVTIDYVVGPKQEYHDYKELRWAETEFELSDWLTRKK
jgi:hypothetical protein